MEVHAARHALGIPVATEGLRHRPRQFAVVAPGLEGREELLLRFRGMAPPPLEDAGRRFVRHRYGASPCLAFAGSQGHEVRAKPSLHVFPPQGAQLLDPRACRGQAPSRRQAPRTPVGLAKSLSSSSSLYRALVRRLLRCAGLREHEPRPRVRPPLKRTDEGPSTSRTRPRS